MPYVYSLAVQADGKLLVGGFFTWLGGQQRQNIGRLNTPDPATQNLSRDSSTLTWLRGGASPEVWRTTFDASTNGTDWISLGTGSRIPGGWQLTNAALPPGGTIRARGYVTGGQYNASSWFVETMIGPPVISFNPYSATNNARTTASFSAFAGGTEPLRYQWFKDGVALADGGNLGGATTPTLSVSNLLKADEGGYRVVVTNAQGSVTSQVATLTVTDPWITGQPASQIGSLGESVTFSVTAVGTAPLGYQWWKDGVALGQGTGAALTLTNLQLSDGGNYWAAVSSPYGSLTSSVAVLTVNTAALDRGFNLANLGADYDSPSVSSLAVQADGKLLVGGYFTTLGGQPRHYIGRLNADGTLDSAFNPGAGGSYSTVSSLAVQSDGKILLVGGFSTLGGQTRFGIGRLNADGTLDGAFNPGASSWVKSLAVQADGKILVGGEFTTLGGQTRSYIGRVNADGTVDSGFNPGASGPVVWPMAAQADGRILVGGYFTTLGGQSRSGIGRLNADGTLDSGFNPGAGGVYPFVHSLAVQADGKILVGGLFTTLGGQPRNHLARLNANGIVDSGFNPGAGGGEYPSVYSLAVQADGKILVGGEFTTLGGQPRTNIARLNADGTLDGDFNPGASLGPCPGTSGPSVSSLAVQADGKILVGGSFTTLGGQPRTSIARFNNTGSATRSLSYDGSTLTWLRGGTSPEAWRTTFEVSTNATSWSGLGAGTRIPGGWQLTGVSVPFGGTIRARGYVTGGRYNGSCWFVEAFWTNTAPVIFANDASFGFRSNRFGFNVGGLAGAVVVVETSPNLVDWWPLYTNLLPSGPLYFSDPGSTNSHWRFYRARLQP
jgi:uncharacterized delta-60 repeat protein